MAFTWGVLCVHLHRMCPLENFCSSMGTSTPTSRIKEETIFVSVPVTPVSFQETSPIPALICIWH